MANTENKAAMTKKEFRELLDIMCGWFDRAWKDVIARINDGKCDYVALAVIEDGPAIVRGYKGRREQAAAMAFGGLSTEFCIWEGYREVDCEIFAVLWEKKH